MVTGKEESLKVLEIVQEAFTSLDLISTEIHRISAFSTQIAATVEESSAMAREISANLKNIDN